MLGKEQCLIIYLSLLQILSIFLFLYGFFPDKINHVYSSMDDLPHNLENISLKGVYARQKPLLVLMVIDALRYDFVDGNANMPYLSNVLKKDKNCLLKARVEPPTVTLPRVKALMTGSIPSFYDIVSNFGSVELKDDNIISKAISSGMKVVFYGDDTWLKLFPNKFLRSDGTTSFFVNDFFEVDDNVTRHLDKELNSNDWDIMILHYLGLDHIGHVEGPYGPQIKPKLAEMDNIINVINEKLISKNPDNPGILVICGDHGMKDSGGHGGTSLSEVLVPVVFLNYKCDSKISDEIKQVDVTPLLSILMGLPIPGGSVGKINMKLLNGLKPELMLYSLYYNTLRMYELYATKNENSQIEEEIQNGNNLYKTWILSNYTNNDYYGAGLKFSEAQKQMSSAIIKDSISFDDYILLIAVIIMFQVVFLIILYYLFNNINFKPKLSHFIFFILILIFHYFMCFMSDCDSKMCILKYFPETLFIFIILSANFFFFQSKQLNIQYPSIIHVVLICGLILHLASLTSSSFIEEEHQFWFFVMTTLSLYLLPFDYKRFSLLLILQTFLRKINQTGDKWAHLPDIGDWLNAEENKYYLTFYFILGLIFVFKSQLLNHHNMKPIISLIDSCFILSQLIMIFLYKTATGSCIFTYTSDSRGIIEARLFWILTLLRNIFQLYFIKLQQSSVQNSEIINLLINNILSVVTLLSKPHNVVLLPSLIFFSRVFSKVNPKCHVSQAFFHYWIGVLFYFYQGNSNSIANIDIGVGYTGLEEYNKYITGSYIFLHTYSGQILSFVLMLKTLNNVFLSTYSSLFTLIFISSLTTLFYMVVITFQRYHLFVWSVFAPKLMFVCAQAGLISFCNVFAVIYFTASNYVIKVKC